MPPRQIREQLDLGDDETECVRIERVRSLKEKLLTFSTNYLPVGIGGKIEERALYEKPLLRILEEDLCVRFREAVQTIAASFADAETARRLAVPSGSPILFVERVVYGTDKKPIEVFQSSYPGDLYRFIVRYRKVMQRSGSTWVHREN